MKGMFALSIADTFGSGDFPQPSKIIKITFLFMVLILNKDKSFSDFYIKYDVANLIIITAKNN
jgi:hypothetical protein